MLALGQTEAAKEHFRMAMMISPGYPDASQGFRATENL
jgi:hypothetical protein